MMAIHHAHEGRVDAEADHAADRLSQRARLLLRELQEEVFVLAQPRLTVLARDRESRFVGAVGTAAVPQAADEEDCRAGRHAAGDGFLALGRAVGPTVAA